MTSSWERDQQKQVKQGPEGAGPTMRVPMLLPGSGISGFALLHLPWASF